MNAFERTFGFINSHPLAKYHLGRAYFRFIIWQIRCRLSSNLLKVKFINNTIFLAKRGLAGITGNIYTGLHEFPDMGFLLHFLRPNDFFFDVGANVGAYTLLASSACHANTIAFEPVPQTFKILSDNISINNINHLVSLENSCVGNKTGTIQFSSNEDTTNRVVSDDSQRMDTIWVPILKLESLFPEYKPILIKIDVEGFEAEVLNGANNILKDKTLKGIIIELIGCGNRYGHDEIKIHELLLENDFEPYSYNPFDRQFTKTPKFGSSNTIYLRDLPFVNERVGKALPFTIFGRKI